MKNRNKYLQAACLTAISGLTIGCKEKQEDQKPCLAGRQANFLFVLVDDMGWTDLTCFGSSFYETPNIDKLASEGMMFTDAYASCPVSSPTRASIMTGKFTTNHGITDWIPGRRKWKPKEDCFQYISESVEFKQHLDLEEVTIAEALKEGGYITHFAGKWHLGKEDFYPEKQGFDFNIGGCDKGGPYGNSGYFFPFGPPVPQGKEGDFLTDKLTDITIDFIKANKDTSFFAYLSFYTLHNPIMAPDSLVEKYQKKADALGYTQEQRFNIDADWMKQWPNYTEGSYDNYKERLVQDNAVYAAMVEIMDNNIGKLMTALKEEGIDDKTVIIFTGDNGGLSSSEGSNTCNLPLREGKGWLYEGGIREATIIKWPGVTKAGSKSDALVSSPDYYPTMLEIAGLPLKPEQHIDGQSLVPVLKGEAQGERSLFWHYPHYSNQGGGPGSAIRKGDYKLIKWFEDDKVELFNLKEDIGETKELSASEPEKRKELEAELDQWLKDTGAKFMDKNPDYKKVVSN